MIGAVRRAGEAAWVFPWLLCIIFNNWGQRNLPHPLCLEKSVRRPFNRIKTAALFLLAAGFTHAADSNRKVLDGNVVAVTVFSDRAQITREAVITLNPGTYSLCFEKIPTTLDANSLQVSGTGNAVISDLKYRTEYTVEVNDGRIKPLLERKVSLSEKLEDLAVLLRNIDLEKRLLEGFKERALTSRSESNVIHETKKWQEILEFYRIRLDRLDQDAVLKNRERARIEADIRALDEEVRSLGGVKRKEKKFIEVVLEAKVAGPVKVLLSYIAFGPSWAPVYDVRADREGKGLKLQAYAVVRQASEEDWMNVALRLSTAKPYLGGTQPNLEPWYLKEYTPPPRSYGRRAMSEDREMSMMKKERAMPAPSAGAPGAPVSEEAAPEPPEIRQAEASVDEGQGATVFALDGKSTVQNDNQPHRVFLFDRDYHADFEYSAVPKLAPFAYLRASVTNTNEATLLPGPMNIFVNGAYLATGHLPQVAVGEPFFVSLGVDESVQVTHRLVRRFKEADALLSGANRWSYRYLITVKNSRKTPESFRITDQFPMPTREDIKVTRNEPPVKRDKNYTLPWPKILDNGLMEWTFDLKPGEKLELPVSFQIEYPRSMNIQGLQ